MILDMQLNDVTFWRYQGQQCVVSSVLQLSEYFGFYFNLAQEN